MSGIDVVIPLLIGLLFSFAPIRWLTHAKGADLEVATRKYRRIGGLLLVVAVVFMALRAVASDIAV